MKKYKPSYREQIRHKKLKQIQSAPVTDTEPHIYTVLHDSDFPPYISRLERMRSSKRIIGIPSTVKLSATKPSVNFTKEWQLYSFDLLKRRVRQLNPNAPESSIEFVARSLFKSAYTSDRFQSNKNGTESKADFVNLTNLKKEPIKLEPIITAGNIVSATGSRKRIAGAEYAEIICFNVNNEPPNADDVNFETHPELVFLGTIETRIPKEPNGRVIRFFDFTVPKVKVNKKDELPAGITTGSISAIPYFVLTETGTAWIPVSRLK